MPDDIRQNQGPTPIFSICIPQYNRTSFLLEACKSIIEQDFDAVEICISDDCSNDGRNQEVIDFLSQSKRPFVYRRQDNNKRYDGNIREAISLATGRYCLLLGNDDCFSHPKSLNELYAHINNHNYPAVVICNYEDWSTGEITRRILSQQLFVDGPVTAINHYRNVAFVSGVLIDRQSAHQHATNLWDGSEMYQMFLMARTIACGGKLLEIEESYIRKDICIPGESIDSYVKPKLNPCPIEERLLPMRHIGAVITDAIKPATISPALKNKLTTKVFSQLYFFTYPYWVLEYKRVQSWKYALGVALGLLPKHTLNSVELSLMSRIRLSILSRTMFFIALLIPVKAYKFVEKFMYRLAKSN